MGESEGHRQQAGQGASIAQTTTGSADDHGATGQELSQRQGHGNQQASPLADPGLPVHRPRPTDVDPRAAKRAERQVAGLLTVSSIASIGFVVAYFAIDVHASLLGVGAQNVALGASGGVALFLIGIAAIQWAKKLMYDEEMVEVRHRLSATPEERREAVDILVEGGRESGLARRTLIKLSIAPALGLLVAPVIVLLRDLGTLPGNDLKHTSWTSGMRVVQDITGDRIKAADIQIGSLINVMPADLYPTGPDGTYTGPSAGEIPGGDHIGELETPDVYVRRGEDAAIIVRIEPGVSNVPPQRQGWDVAGIFCYSKICVHMGCPISLYENQTHHLLCPCHQSVYDLADGGKVLFGPATRAIPQLPIMVDSEGYLVAQSDFHEPVGPSFWERNRT